MSPDFRPGGGASGGLFSSVDPYPAARADRNKPISTNSSMPAVAGVPRTFNWGIHVREATVDERCTVVSRRLQGPAYVDTLWLDFSQGGAVTPSNTFQIGYALSPVTEGRNLPLAEPAGVTWFHESDYADDAVASGPGLDGVYPGQMSGGAPSSATMRIGAAILAPEFFLVASIRSRQVNALTVNGSLRVLLNVEPDILAELVASA